MSEKRQKIDGIQVLRAIAALAVVASHAITRAERSLEGHSAGALLPDLGRFFSFGHFGVDLFFVISGFVMVYVHYRDFGQAGAPQKFLLRRLARIVPIYWILSAVAVALLAVAPQLFYYRSTVDWSWVAVHRRSRRSVILSTVHRPIA